MNALVYRDYDQAELDGQYNNLARIPDHAAITGRWTLASREVRERVDCQLDIAYGRHPRERLDLFFPDDPSRLHGAPLLAFFHGGYWYAQAKENFSYVAQGLVEEGVIVAVVEYALCPDVDLPEIVRQSRAAMAWLSHNAVTFGGDPERIYASGHSAGGHLAVMTLATDWPVFDAGLPDLVVKGAAAIGGIFDLEPIRLCFLNETLALDIPMARELSPIHNLLLPQASVAVAVGGDESDEFRRQSLAYAAACRENGNNVKLMVIDNHHHISIMDEFGSTEGLMTSAILEQIMQDGS